MGGPSAATKQQQQLTLQSTQQQMQFNTQLMSLFQQQFAAQKSTLDFLKSVMQPVISNAQAGHGFSPDALAAMRTSATDNLSGQFSNAQAALNQELRSSGSADVPSGVTVGADTALLNAEAQAGAGAQREITLADAAQAKSDLFNASNVLNGVAAQTNPLGYASAANSGSGTVASLGGAQSELQNAITNANNSSFFGKLSSGIASGIGNFIGGGSGQGGLFTALATCWIAAAVFGEDFYTGTKTNLVRKWLWNEWSNNWYAKPILWAYRRFGKAIAKNPTMVRLLTPLFKLALKKAMNG